MKITFDTQEINAEDAFTIFQALSERFPLKLIKNGTPNFYFIEPEYFTNYDQEEKENFIAFETDDVEHNFR